MYEGDVAMVSVRGERGEVGILAGEVAMVGRVKMGGVGLKDSG